LSLSQRKKIDAVGKQISLAYWALKANILLDGKPFNFDRHEYLVDIYMDESPYMVAKKAAQLGFTTYFMLRSIFRCRNIYPTGVLYLFPTKDDVSDFSKARMAPLISQNPNTIGSWLQSTDQTNIKQIGLAFLYLRGSRTRTALKSIPVDAIIFDEYDEMRPGVGATSADKKVKFDPIALARERYSHSDFQHEAMLSTPTLPDYGIEKEFQDTDQKHWYIYCDACNTETCLELTFPNCLKPQKDGTVIRACKKCGKEINPSNGRWIAHNSGRDKSGYYISQLCSQYINPYDIYKTYTNLDNLKATERTEFWNSKIGIGYVEVTSRLTEQQIYALCTPEPMKSMDQGDHGPCIMGVDQGNNLHVIIGKRVSNTTKRVVHIGKYENWQDIDVLMERFNVWRCVVDAQPEQRNARDLAYRHWGKIFLNYYIHSQKGSVKWDHGQLLVSENRTESLDDSHALLANNLIILPRKSEEVDEFARHSSNIAKKLEEDEETGSKKYTYVTLGADHYRHAFNYFNIASENAPLSYEKEESQIEGFRQSFARPRQGKRLCDTYH